jgi:hypothetical protein
VLAAHTDPAAAVRLQIAANVARLAVPAINLSFLIALPPMIVPGHVVGRRIGPRVSVT